MRAISTIRYFGTPTGTLPVFDELRVAITYQKVIPDLPLLGDTNGDGEVDMLDYKAIVTHLSLTGQSTLNGDVADAGGRQHADGRVDLRDLNLWKKSLTGLPLGVTSGLGVLEPGTIALGRILGIHVAWSYRTRRSSV